MNENRDIVNTASGADTSTNSAAAEKKKPGRKSKAELDEQATAEHARLIKMTDLAQRQWAGQAPDLPVGERIGRIRIAMKRHGYMDLWEDNIAGILKLGEKDKRYI
jgi:hypothetical protein